MNWQDLNKICNLLIGKIVGKNISLIEFVAEAFLTTCDRKSVYAFCLCSGTLSCAVHS